MGQPPGKGGGDRQLRPSDGGDSAQGRPSLQGRPNGTPQRRPIEGPPLRYVVSSPDAVEVDPITRCAAACGSPPACSMALGPWPSLFPRSPIRSPRARRALRDLVNISWVSPESVEIAYTPGYMRTALTTDWTVDCGTGYDYTGWAGDVYYPTQPTCGYAVLPGLRRRRDHLLLTGLPGARVTFWTDFTRTTYEPLLPRSLLSRSLGEAAPPPRPSRAQRHALRNRTGPKAAGNRYQHLRSSLSVADQLRLGG
jgi:hypothetical protein